MQKLEEKYGIPTFETCKKLAEYWKEKTNFNWFKLIKTNELVVGFREYNNYLSIGYNACYYAPQIHELLEVLPNTIIYENYFYGLELYKDCVFYSGLNRDIFEVENSNLAECLAQIYLKLKQNKLL